MIIVHRIDEGHADDARLPNQPFTVWGRMVPSLKDGKWGYTTVCFCRTKEMTFPDEDYDITKENEVFLGAYENGKCVGLAVLRRGMFRYLYLDDLKVSASCRGRGIGAKMVAACLEEAGRLGLRGVYTVGQDNNLSACLFYIGQGFRNGGFDNRCYDGTAQEGNANIFFYRDI